ncbi:MAG: hypothetical protein N4A48_11450 [Tepidibacter sp.]|jgi:hypothetical protein|uniref:hypothetical protein n=1 Tax=Tepidibacter sp. TaxID=2529387 RepID=UPI0025CDE329|nr:hypothetical protein [Tepidibacter sp.]MCT4509344.1 hypothetical protein [Tepidibacter sp.]
MSHKNPEDKIDETYDSKDPKTPTRPLTNTVMPFKMKDDSEYDLGHMDPLRSSEYHPFIPSHNNLSIKEIEKKTR